MAQKLSFACVEMYDGLREGWHTSCYRNSSQEHIAVLLPCFLFCFCAVLFVWLFFVCFAFCVFCFLWFLFRLLFLLVCARSRQLDSFMDYVKVHTSSLLWLFMHINSISGKLKLV